MRDRSRIRRRYLRSWCFPWDVAAVLPTDLLYLRLGPAAPAVRANRCLRAPRLFEAFDRRETRTGHPNAFRMAKLMLYVFVAIHWYGCLYFALSARLGLGTDAWVCPNASRPGFARPLRQYLHSFYFSTLVLATVGDTPEPRREEEFLFVTAGFLLAVLGFATITGSIGSVISNMNAADAVFYPDPEPVRRYLRSRGAGGRLARRVASWHQHLRAQRKLPAEQAVLRHLPQGLRAEVAAGVHLPALRRVGLFQSWERGVLRQLVLRLRPQVFGPGEFVCRRGDVGREMYFVREGRLAVLAEDGVTQLAVLGEGLYFGEISLINIKGETAAPPPRRPPAPSPLPPQPRHHGGPPRPPREHLGEPAHGQHHEHRLLRPLLPLQGGLGGGAGRVPQRSGHDGGQGPPAAAQHGQAGRARRGGGGGGGGGGRAAGAGPGAGPGGAAEAGGTAAGAAGVRRLQAGVARPAPRGAAPAAAAAGRGSGA